MLHKIFSHLDSLGLATQASAHCDIPCGIYDPTPAIIAALSVVRLMDIANDGVDKLSNEVAKANFLARCALRKEEEAEKVKQEIRVIWGDYFKGDLLKTHPSVHDLAHSIMLKGSACKQDVHREDAVALLDLVNQFAEMYWSSKGIGTRTVKSPYPPNLNMVQPVLS